eukprot:gene4879-5233_t
MGIQQIRQRIQTLYESFIHDRSIPHIRAKLDKYISNFEDQMLELGVPLPQDNEYLELTTFLTRVMKVNWLITFDEEWIRTFIAKVLQNVLDLVANLFKSLDEPTTFWKLFEQYHNFIGQEDRDIPLSTSASYSLQARETLELKVRECLIQIWGQLRDRIDPNPKILEIIHTLFLQMAMREDPKFKLERFDFLHTALVKVVADQLNKIIVSFDKWFQDFISHLNEKPLLKPAYHSPGAMRCTLYWSNQR